MNILTIFTKNYFSSWLFVFFSFTAIVAQNSDIRIELSNNQQILLFGEETTLSEVSTVINKKINRLPEEEQRLQSVSISLGASISDDFLDLVKEEVKKTPVRFLNVQRSIISTYNQANPITDAMIAQYNTLIEGWNTKEEHDRFYRKIELDFVEGVSKRMSFHQQMKAEKLPGYLPFVKRPEAVEKIEMQDFERWKFDESYRIFINQREVDKSFLAKKKPADFDSYFVLRKLENEQKITEVYLTEESLDFFNK